MSEPKIISVMDRSDASFFTVVQLPEPRSKGRPWAIYFVYAPQGNFIVKGNSESVHSYVDKNFPLSLTFYTFWGLDNNGKKHRGGLYPRGISILKRPVVYKKNGLPCDCWSCRNCETFPEKIFKNASKSARFAVTRDYKNFLFYRNLPKKWLPEWSHLPTKSV